MGRHRGGRLVHGDTHRFHAFQNLFGRQHCNDGIALVRHNVLAEKDGQPAWARKQLFFLAKHASCSAKQRNLAL
jgi:hypothetical protein